MLQHSFLQNMWYIFQEVISFGSILLKFIQSLQEKTTIRRIFGDIFLKYLFVWKCFQCSQNNKICNFPKRDTKSSTSGDNLEDFPPMSLSHFLGKSSSWRCSTLQHQASNVLLLPDISRRRSHGDKIRDFIINFLVECMFPGGIKLAFNV